MLKELSDRPEIDRLQTFVQRLLDERGDEVEFVVLFGSMARGDWLPGSDYDVFIGLRGDDGLRLVDRMLEFSQLAEGTVEVFPYARSQWDRMFRGPSAFLLEVLEHGVVLWDHGGFAEMRRTFHRWREAGLVTPYTRGWRISEDLPSSIPSPSTGTANRYGGGETCAHR